MTTAKRKSPTGFGERTKLPSGNYRVRYVVDGVRYSAPTTFRTAQAADAWRAKMHDEVTSGAWVPPEVRAERKRSEEAEAERRRITLGDYATKWNVSRTNTRGMPLSPNTIRERERLLRPAGQTSAEHPGGPLAELVPLVLADITADRVRDWRARQMERGTITQTSRAYELLKAIMATALEDELIDKQPCTIKGGSTASTGIEHAPPANEEQFVKLLDATDEAYKALVVIGAASGCRYGEAVDLRDDDITVHLDDDGAVEHVVVRIDSQRGRDASEAKTGAKPKSRGREVLVFGEDADIIAARVEGLAGRDYLFPAVKDKDRPLSESTFWRHFNRARIAAELPTTRFHDLRHYAGTRYAQGGATLKEIMARLGHSTASAAMRYQHDADEARLAQLAASAGRARRASTPST
ncbi:tyrosine-type recombinase/integrase [Microbacterium lacticum]